MFENIIKFFKNIGKKEEKNETENSKDAAKERLHLVLMQDRANVSADFLELMKQEIIEVIKKYIDVDESAIDVRLTNKENEDGTNGAPALYANIPKIPNITPLTKLPAAPPTPKLLIRSRTETAKRIRTVTSSRINAFSSFRFAVVFLEAVVFFRVVVRRLPEFPAAIAYVLPFYSHNYFYYIISGPRCPRIIFPL